ncbi:MAG: hypothetical protein AB7O59_09425 [Pirellulales bacterium]
MRGPDPTLTDLLAECDAHGIRLLPGGHGGLTIDAPQEVLTPKLIERLRTHKAGLVSQLRPKCWAGPRRAAPPTAAKLICRCGSTTWLDVPIHDGQSTRRDCARCGRFIDFSRWYGRDALQTGE